MWLGLWKKVSKNFFSFRAVSNKIVHRPCIEVLVLYTSVLSEKVRAVKNIWEISVYSVVAAIYNKM